MASPLFLYLTLLSHIEQAAAQLKGGRVVVEKGMQGGAASIASTVHRVQKHALLQLLSTHLELYSGWHSIHMTTILYFRINEICFDHLPSLLLLNILEHQVHFKECLQSIDTLIITFVSLFD